jgi:hypothetical protein
VAIKPAILYDIYTEVELNYLKYAEIAKERIIPVPGVVDFTKTSKKKCQKC